jgi:hypothetical protein
MMVLENLPPGIKGWGICQNCFFEKLENGHWRWRCDSDHPEILAQMEEWRQAQQRAREEEEEEFWRRRDY